MEFAFFYARATKAETAAMDYLALARAIPARLKNQLFIVRPLTGAA